MRRIFAKIQSGPNKQRQKEAQRRTGSTNKAL